MKWSFNHKSRKAFLTAAICLALSQSVFAMPTGGKVVDGTVTGILENGTVANGTINVNSNALIDWEAFNIAKGETLNFKFGQDYLNVINHVTGSEMSQLLGALNAKNGNVYLINPNGILVGGGARIDAGSLILSTLDATNDQLKIALKDGLTNLDLTSNAGSKGITIENGANIKVGPFLGLLGNKVQIADNVTISDAPYDKNETTLVVAAADKASLVLTGGGAEDIASVTTGKDNTVTIGKADFNINNNFTDSYFLGNAISMKGTKLNINSRDQGNSSTALDIIAADSYGYTSGDEDAVSLAMNPANRLDLDDVKASANYMHVIGGQTAINQSDLTLTKTTDKVKEGDIMPYMKVAALNGKDIVLDDSEDVPQNIANTDGAKLTIKDSNLTSNENIALWGGSVELTNTDLKTLEETNEKDNNIDIDAFKSFDDKGVTTDSFNTVKVTVGSLESGGDISVQGSSIALDGVKDVKSATDKPDKGIFLMASKKLNKVTLSAQGDVMAYGKTVKLQDSNLSTTNDQDLTINALNTYKRVDGTSDTWTATKDNTMDVTGTTLTNKGIIELSSGKLTMDKSNLTATGKEGAILVDARASYTDDDNGAYVNKAVNGMDVSIKDSNFSGDNGVLVVGNTVTIDGQSAAKSTNAKVFFATGTESEMTDTSIKGNGAPVNVGKDVKYDAKNTEFAPSMKTIETKPDQPSKPDKPIVTPDPKPAVDVEKNIEQGKQDMTKALADNQDNASAAVKQQAEKLSSSKMTDEEKAAQVKGYAEAIENSQASAEEKQALVKDTVKSFEPTQQSSIEAQNKQDEAAQNNNAQTVIPDVTVKTVAPAEHEGAAATVTVDGTVVNE